MRRDRRRIILNVGAFGMWGVERAATDLLNHIPLDRYEVVLHQLYERPERSRLLDQLPADIRVTTSMPRGSWWGDVHGSRHKGVHVKLLDSLGVLAMRRRAAESINRLQADLVIDYDLSLQKAARLIQAPKIGVVHFSPRTLRGGRADSLRRMGSRLKNYHSIVLLCDEMLHDARQVWPMAGDRFVTIPNPLNRARLLADAKAPADLPPGIQPGRYIVNVARLTPDKGLPCLLRAYAQARSDSLDWPLLLVGDGQDRRSLEQLASDLGVGDSVHFLGYRTNPAPLVAQAGMFVLSSVTEGFGIALAEALTLGCPAISTACPVGPSDVLGHGRNGLLVPVGDHRALKESMIRLFRDTELRGQLAVVGREVSRAYDAPHVARRFLDLNPALHAS